MVVHPKNAYCISKKVAESEKLLQSLTIKRYKMTKITLASLRESLSSSDIPTLKTADMLTIRRHLHRYPELSGQEQQTAQYIAEQLRSLNPTHLYQNIANTGVAAVFDSGNVGKTLLFRCELDALPIQEVHVDNTIEYTSCHDGVAHQCGHDGHMAIILALGKRIAEKRPQHGRVVLLFQPAEETGEGARAVVADSQFTDIQPDESYALHNLPGYPMAQVILRKATFNCASRGMIIRFSGRTAHAAYPETGKSPQLAIAELLKTLNDIPQTLKTTQLAMLTVVHCQMGEQAFGTAPADGCVMVTLRTETNEAMQSLVAACQHLVEQTAEQYELEHTAEWSDCFDASINDAACVEQVAAAALATGHKVEWIDEPFRWSEDFGAISATSRGAMFAYGAGVNTPQIHNPDYVFPDELIESGCDLFFEIYRKLR